MEAEKIDNSAFALARLKSLYTDPDLSDITLKVGRKVYSSHRLILSISSDVFKTMLTGSTWPESKSKRIVLQEDPDCEEVFEDFLKYLYSGEVTLHHATVLPLLTLADKYNVPDLSKSCLQYMCAHCLPVSGGYVVAWLQYAIIFGSKRLEDTCRRFITYNFKLVIQTREFLLINTDILLSFLRSSDLVVKDEFHLYTAMKSWLLAHHNTSNQSEFSTLFHRTMSCIRFPMMQLGQLASLQSDPLVKDFKDFYLDNLFRAMKYHTSASKEKFCPDHCQPRNYTSETWSTVITVENFSSILPGDVHSAFFSTPASCCDLDQHRIWDWHVDLYPKGVVFKRCLMIDVPNNLTLDEKRIRTVRITVSAACEERRKVEISILFISKQESSTEYVRSAVTRYAIFDPQSPLHNIDDIVPFNDLNCVQSPYIIYPDTIKIVVVIKPVV